MESGLQEIRREKVFISPDMGIKELMEKYGVAASTARNGRKKGWLIKNYLLFLVLFFICEANFLYIFFICGANCFDINLASSLLT